MEDKTKIISYIKEQLNQGTITQADLGALVSPGKDEKKSFSKNMTNIFYIIGAIIVLIGVIILFSMHWNDIGLFGKIVATLGIGLVAYVSAILIRGSELRILSQILFVVAAVLGSMGVFILLDQANINVELMTQFVIAIVMALIFSFAYYVNRRNILPLLVVGFITWAYYALILEILPHGSGGVDLLKYATMILGVSYGLIAYGFSKKMISEDGDERREKRGVSHILYFLGTGAFLGGGIAIGGVFDFVQILLIFGLFYLSIYLKSKSILLVSALFLMAHIVKISIEYFVNTVGWPIVLIISGIAVILVGVGTHRLSRGIKENK